MRVAGIICEYNPMHSGHAYHLEKTRLAGATHIALCMSANFTQRGEPAVMDKSLRAKAAVLSGADLVVELPVPWSCDCAERFADAGVFILSRLGCDVLSFGCEEDNAELLHLAAAAVGDSRVGEIIKSGAHSGLSYPRLLSHAVKSVYGERVSAVLSGANNTLAAEYIRAIKRHAPGMDILPVKRLGAGHDDESGALGTVSSAYLRRNYKSPASLSYLTEAARQIVLEQTELGRYPCTLEHGQRAVLCALRSMTAEQMSRYVLDSTGLCSRLSRAAKTQGELSAVLAQAKTKNVTLSKVRRAVMSCFLQIPKDMSQMRVPYIRVLASNERGFEILKRANPALPVIARRRDVLSLGESERRFYDFSCAVNDKYGLFAESIIPCGSEQQSGAFILK